MKGGYLRRSIELTHEMECRIKRNYQKNISLKKSALEIGICSVTLRKFELRLGLHRPKTVYTPIKASYAFWDGIHYFVTHLCGCDVIVAKHSENPHWEIARKIPIQEIVYEAQNETRSEVIEIAKRMERDFENDKSGGRKD